MLLPCFLDEPSAAIHLLLGIMEEDNEAPARLSLLLHLPHKIFALLCQDVLAKEPVVKVHVFARFVSASEV